jgi:tetratricopeptide (TPR) repeat protein
LLRPSTLSADTEAKVLPARAPQPIERRIFYVLAGIALIYAFLAGLATVGDPDFGWQLARGRWIAQHHHVFSTDVLSYTVPGAPAIYPALGGVLLYWVYVIGGYKLLSWLCAAVCVASFALLLRRGSAFTAAIAILVMPFMALRMAPRSELFAIVLFAAYVSILWENSQTGRARLWLLPLLMALWVNIHFSFFSAFGLLAAFAGIDVLELLAVGARRTNAIRRLKREIPWFLATLAATLVNPWGWKIYKETAQYTGVALAIHVNEWDPLHWNWTNPVTSFTLRNTNDLGHVVLLVILVSIAVALFSRQLGAAILLAAATYEVTHHLRFLALASCIVVVVAGAVLASTTPWIRSHIPNPRARLIAAVTFAGMFAALAVMRSLDVVSNYHYLAERNLSTFGAGLSGTFPQAAALFIQNQNLPGEVFNTYNEGGYTLWALGPQRRDYVDGREIPFGAAFLQHAAQMSTAPLYSTMWQQEADRYGINTLILPLTMDEIPLDLLKGNCDSKQWRPVYLDEVSIVLLRRTPQNEDLIKRFAVDCATAPIPRDPLPLTAATFNQWVNAARVLSALGRQPEALAAIDKAMSIFPDNAQVHWYRGQILYASDRHAEAETEWQKALALSPREITPWASLGDFQASIWSSLAQLYHRERSVPEETQALQAMLRLSTDPSVRLQAMMSLGSLNHAIGRDSEAEKQWLDALALDPQESATWFLLADLYQHDGRLPQAIHALEQGTALSSDAATKAHAQVKMARLYLMSHRPEDALRALDEAARIAPTDLMSEKTGRSFSFDIAQGRAAAWASKGDLEQATSFEEQAVQLDPDAPDAWARLAKLYQRQGRPADQQRAENNGKKLLAGTPGATMSN